PPLRIRFSCTFPGGLVTRAFPGDPDAALRALRAFTHDREQARPPQHVTLPGRGAEGLDHFEARLLEQPPDLAREVDALRRELPLGFPSFRDRVDVLDARRGDVVARL